MDLEIQQRVKDLTEKFGAENVVVVIGGAEAEASGLSAETVAAGDPTYAGPLAGIALGLAVYHVIEPEVKDEFDATVYDEQCGMMEMVLDVDAIISEVKTVRDQYSKY
jgi:glycine reductase